jgi:N-acetylglucosamine kinase-like BadF-type ATPase
MILIADSGSTTTDWCLLNTDLTINKYIRTSGLNANYLTDLEIFNILSCELTTLLPYPISEKITSVFFYGSGCSTEEKQQKIKIQISKITPNANVIADHDMLGAAISLCGNDMGIVCILGTGSNSCFYDGKNVKKTILSLGYLLGDEGSGTHIGKKILYAYLKNKMPQDIQQLFYSKYQKLPEDMVAEMYAAQKVGAYFAEFSHFSSENLNMPYIQNIVKDCFRDFLREQVAQFDEAKSLPLGFVGSVATVFQQELKAVTNEFGYTLGKIIQNPINGLVEFYQKKSLLVR